MWNWVYVVISSLFFSGCAAAAAPFVTSSLFGPAILGATMVGLDYSGKGGSGGGLVEGYKRNVKNNTGIDLGVREQPERTEQPYEAANPAKVEPATYTPSVPVKEKEKKNKQIKRIRTAHGWAQILEE